jgi:hypothetical protein
MFIAVSAAPDTLNGRVLDVPTCVWSKLILVRDVSAGNVVWGLQDN